MESIPWEYRLRSGMKKILNLWKGKYKEEIKPEKRLYEKYEKYEKASDFCFHIDNFYAYDIPHHKKR